MTRLSIIIPAGDDVSSLEDTLVSVLANRPSRCEVIVCHAGNYADPYDLHEEVRFLQIPPAHNTAEQIAKAVNVAGGRIIHVLSPGCEVQDGWTTAAVQRLEVPYVASAAPLVLAADGSCVRTAGVGVGLGGRRIELGRGCKLGSKQLSRVRIAGPTLLAGFYRRDALERVGGWSTAVGASLSDLDVALSLQRLDYESAIVPQSQVTCKKVVRPRESAFARSRGAERLFLRHTLSVLSNVLHPVTSIGQCLAAGGPIAIVAATVGKMAAAMDVSACRKHAAWLDEQKAVAGKVGDDRHSTPPDTSNRPTKQAA